MGRRGGRRKAGAIAFALLCLILFSLIGCTSQEQGVGSVVFVFDDKHNSYDNVAAQMLPAYTISKINHPIPTLNEGAAAVEVFNNQALPALEYGVAVYWYPQYLATVIIAVDRDMTDAIVTGWSDLPNAGETVGFVGLLSVEMVFAAVAYGLDGESFSLRGAAELLAGLRAKGLFAFDSYDQPIVICYDYQAAAMIREGRNLEVVVPREGTLTYERGLLSNVPLSFTGDVDSLLISAGLRLLDGHCDSILYPSAAAYENAHTIKDYEHLNSVCQDGVRTLRRTVLLSRLYSSADGKEHQLFALLYMVLIVVWLSTVMHRAIQKSVRQSALLTAVILVVWLTLRMVKYQIEDPTLGRYLWYSYYLFQLALPIVALYLAWGIDRHGDMSPPKWLRAIAAVSGALVLLTFTNDLHSFVLQIDLSNLNWSEEYGYGFAFWIIQTTCFLSFAAAVVVMLAKSVRNPHKKGLVFPIVFIALLTLYGIGYLTRVPIAWESDFTMVAGVFALLLFESAVRTGMIPVNTKYTVFFTHSPLAMRITDSAGKSVLSSASEIIYDDGTLARALASYPLPVHPDENTLLYATGIAGGNALWQEDITGLNQLHAEIEESIRSLTAANSFLAEEEKIKRAIAEETEKTRLMTEFEAEVFGHTTRLSSMIEQIGGTASQPRDAIILSLLICYVKRQSNLFFREREADTIPFDDLAVYLDELAEIASYTDVKIILTSEIKKPISVRNARLLYSFYYNIVDWAATGSCLSMFAHLRAENGSVSMRLLPSADARTFSPDTELSRAIASAGGAITLTDYDDALGISLSFPEGGEEDG